MNKTIGIMGCGWLGKPLAVQLLKKGYKVKGTTTTISKLNELRDAGIDPYLVKLEETHIDGGLEEFLNGIDLLVLNIPPGLRSNPQSDYEGRIKLLATHVNAQKSIRQLIYISTTAVFKDTNDIPTYTENDLPNAADDKGKKLIAAEEVVKNTLAKNTIIRPGGLIGGDRHPVKYLAGKNNISDPNAPVNLTNRDYLIDIILKIASGKVDQPVLHAISEPHDSRESYYKKMAQEMELESPVFDDSGSIGKKIVSAII